MIGFTSQKLAVSSTTFASVVLLHVAIPTVMGFTICLLAVAAAAAWLMHVSGAERSADSKPGYASSNVVLESDAQLRSLEAELHNQFDLYRTDLARLQGAIG